jgi:ankyrin repeat protein
VKALIDHNARLVARLADGRTALHLAAARGNVEMVKMIMQRSEQNEEEEAKKEDIRKQARMAAREGKSEPMEVDGDTKEDRDEDSDIEMVDEADSDEDMHSTTTGSYVKVKDDNKKGEELLPEDEEEDEPDVYDVNVLTWDTQCSPLHYAILNGNIGVVKTLVQDFGADVLLPVKLLNSHDKSPRGAILTLVLALKLPLDQAKAMTQALLEIGASSAQADMKQATALHYISGDQPRILETLFQFDEPAAKRAINHLAVTGSSWSPSAQSPLMSAILRGNSLAALKLLEAGSAPSVDFNSWIKSTETQDERITTRDSKQNHNDFVRDVEQPVMLAVQTEMTGLVMELLARGADPNTLPKETQRDLLYGYNQRGHTMQSLLDVVRGKIQNLRRYKDEKPPAEPEYKLKEGADYLDGIQTGTYKDFVAKVKLEETRVSDKQVKETWEKRLKEYNERKGIAEKQEAIDALAAEFEQVEKELVAKGAKTFQELHPEKVVEKDDSHRRRSHDRETPPFGIEFDFKVHDLTDETREAYLKL